MGRQGLFAVDTSLRRELTGFGPAAEIAVVDTIGLAVLTRFGGAGNTTFRKYSAPRLLWAPPLSQTARGHPPSLRCMFCGAYLRSGEGPAGNGSGAEIRVIWIEKYRLRFCRPQIETISSCLGAEANCQRTCFH